MLVTELFSRLCDCTLVVEKESNVTTGKEAQAETDRVMVRASCRTAVGWMAKN